MKEHVASGTSIPIPLPFRAKALLWDEYDNLHVQLSSLLQDDDHETNFIDNLYSQLALKDKQISVLQKICQYQPKDGNKAKSEKFKVLSEQIDIYQKLIELDPENMNQQQQLLHTLREQNLLNSSGAVAETVFLTKKLENHQVQCAVLNQLVVNTSGDEKRYFEEQLSVTSTELEATRNKLDLLYKRQVKHTFTSAKKETAV